MRTGGHRTLKRSKFRWQMRRRSGALCSVAVEHLLMTQAEQGRRQWPHWERLAMLWWTEESALIRWVRALFRLTLVLRLWPLAHTLTHTHTRTRTPFLLFCPLPTADTSQSLAANAAKFRELCAQLNK